MYLINVGREGVLWKLLIYCFLSYFIDVDSVNEDGENSWTQAVVSRSRSGPKPASSVDDKSITNVPGHLMTLRLS